MSIGFYNCIMKYKYRFQNMYNFYIRKIKINLLKVRWSRSKKENKMKMW